MSGYHQDAGSYPADGQYGWSDQAQQGSYNFDMSGSQFGQQQDFQTFENLPQQEGNFSPGYAGNTYLNPVGSPANYQSEIFTPLGSATSDSENFEDEPPLMEELGINPDHIVQKVKLEFTADSELTGSASLTMTQQPAAVAQPTIPIE